jgi:hypothetical protein
MPPIFLSPIHISVLTLKLDSFIGGESAAKPSAIQKIAIGGVIKHSKIIINASNFG